MKKQIDWHAAKRSAERALPLVRDQQVDFVTTNSHFRVTSNFEDFPPRIVLLFELKPTNDHRLRELYGLGDCTPRLAVIPDDDKRVAAAFMAELAEALKFRARLAWDGDGQLRYVLGPSYEKFLER